jgi:hypothetical protein
MKYVPLNREIINQYGEDKTPHSLRGFAAVEDGEVYGIAGTYLNSGYLTVWMDARDELRKRPKSLIKLLKKLYELPHFGNMVLVYCDRKFDGAEKLIRHFGFEPYAQDFFVKEL